MQAIGALWPRISAALNVVFALAVIAFVVRRVAFANASGVDPYGPDRLSLFAALPARDGATLFVGDSLTDRGEWAEQFGDASLLNRGVASDTTRGVLARAAALTAHAPARIFLMIGVNDLGAGEPVAAVAERYAAILDALRAGAPRATLHCQSLLPVREERAPAGMTNARIQALNQLIARLAAERSCVYIDLFPALSGEGGGLDPRFTVDGVHLTGAGYAAWAKAIAPWMSAAR